MATTSKEIKQLLEQRILVIDGATGTQIQNLEIPKEAWLDDKGVDQEGCNELLNATAPELMREVHNAYAKAGADIIKTNTFGTMPWVLDEYDMGERCYELSKKGAEIVKDVCDQYSTPEPTVKVRTSNIRFLGSMPCPLTAMSYIRSAWATLSSLVFAIPTSSIVRQTKAVPYFLANLQIV